ncbi:MAG: hypothetical protein J7L88_05930 [Thermoplasmata archaeon]|nr:hypothetical protein [Thermoplasmata archaeon]
MGFDNLSKLERDLYEYIKRNDFVSTPWSTARAAAHFGVSKEEIYKALANLTKEIKDNIWIYYHDGALRVVAE